MVLPGIAQEFGHRLRQRTLAQAAADFELGALARQFQPLLAALDLGGAALGDFDPAPVLVEEVAELLFQGHEDGQVLVELGHQPLDDLLDLGQQAALGRALALVALAGLGQGVEQAPRRMGLLHEHAPVQQGDLDEGNDQPADQFARMALQVALVQQHVEQHAHQVDGVLVLGIEPGTGRVHAHLARVGQHFALEPLRQRLAVIADRRAQGRAGLGLQQGQHRQHLALAQRSLVGPWRGRLAATATATAAHATTFLQQLVQRVQQGCRCAGRSRARRIQAVLHGAAGFLPALHETGRPGRRVVLVPGFAPGAAAIATTIATTGRAFGTRAATAMPATQPGQHAFTRQLLVQPFIQFGHHRAQVALAQLDQHQPHFRAQVAGGKRLVHGHADVLGAHRIAVGIQFQPAGDPAQAPVQPQQHRLAVAQQHRGQVARGQARLQFVFAHQAQAIGLAGQRRLGRDRRPGFQ